MNLTKKHKILIIGLGLIDGSYAEALTSWGFEVRSESTRLNSSHKVQSRMPSSA